MTPNLDKKLKELGMTGQDLPPILWTRADELTELAMPKEWKRRHSLQAKHEWYLSAEEKAELKDLNARILIAWCGFFEAGGLSFLANPDGQWESNQADCER